MRQERRWTIATATVLLGVGAWQFSEGAYIHAKARLAQVLLHQAWDRTLAGDRQVKPWSWADTWPVARLVVPSRGVDLLVLAGSNGRTIAFGPGHVFGTALPGKPGNSVIGGHRDTNLAFLEELELGASVLVEDDKGHWTKYVVASTEVVDRHDLWVLGTSDRTELTLITCYPFNALRAGGPQRFVVRAYAENKAHAG
ncbi:MAG TPA: class GN sortase [Steroidobacteraceae bacterium]|nr:class GN sortase [Steroidobacteraceae bacterium]